MILIAILIVDSVDTNIHSDLDIKVESNVDTLVERNADSNVDSNVDSNADRDVDSNGSIVIQVSLPVAIYIILFNILLYSLYDRPRHVFVR